MAKNKKNKKTGGVVRGWGNVAVGDDGGGAAWQEAVDAELGRQQQELDDYLGQFAGGGGDDSGYGSDGGGYYDDGYSGSQQELDDYLGQFYDPMAGIQDQFQQMLDAALKQFPIPKMPEPPPPKKLAEAPEWLAYLNALDLEEKNYRSDTDRQSSLTRSNALYQQEALKPQFAQQRRGIGGQMEARGMARSGEGLRRKAQSRADEGTAQSNIQMGATTQLSNLESQLAQKLIDINGRKADRELQMRSGGYV